MTTTCPNCRIAEQRADYGRYQAGCTGCAVRELAQGPLFHRGGLDGGDAKPYRVALAGLFGDGWRDGHRLVLAQADRIRESRAIL